MFIGTNVIAVSVHALGLRRRAAQRVAARDASARSRTPPSPALHAWRHPSRLPFGACRAGRSLRMMTEVPPIQPCREDVLLGQLVFMNPELLPKFIEENLEEFDASFYEYLQQKIDKSTDLEERVTLNTLKDAITDLMNQLLRKHATEMKDANPKDAEAVSEAQSQRQHEEMYRNLVQHADDPERLQVAVSANYDRFTADFLNYVFGKAHSEQANSPAVARVSQAINDEMKSRMEKAAQRLTEVLRGGSPNEMTKKMREIGSAGGIDEAFMLLVAANTERAKKEGANVQVLQILEQLREQASRIIDEAVKDKELRLVRALLRTEDPEKRRQLLFAAFLSKRSRVLAFGSGTRYRDGDQWEAVSGNYQRAHRKVWIHRSEVGFALSRDW
ncbi:hypothetical protein F1559_000962 [Cyanidiococcus yangmingshanensis]|uniref:Uncharacterized protein n=1 Tax=Cyanidiococcus yangmingshanensis TaxID=2690220 RepID=A0A7J7IES6_9RHOD|nr:hypothetical protein F1559_000962 [Cyanidiococcus yangmingshanensis]